MFDGDVYVGAMVKNYDDLRYTMTYGMVLPFFSSSPRRRFVP